MPIVKTRRSLCLGILSLRAISLFLVAALIVAIFLLTDQQAELSSALSNEATSRIVEALPDAISNDELASDVANYDDNEHITPLLGRAWKNVRQLAHVLEFGALGMTSAFACVAWLGRICCVSRLALFSLLFCMINSLLDQAHRLFVPGREFDVFDLVLDAVGYSLGITVVLAIFTCIIRFKSSGSSL